VVHFSDFQRHDANKPFFSNVVASDKTAALHEHHRRTLGIEMLGAQHVGIIKGLLNKRHRTTSSYHGSDAPQFDWHETICNVVDHAIVKSGELFDIFITIVIDGAQG